MTFRYTSLGAVKLSNYFFLGPPCWARYGDYMNEIGQNIYPGSKYKFSITFHKKNLYHTLEPKKN